MHVLELDVPPLTKASRSRDYSDTVQANGFRSLLQVLKAALQFVEKWVVLVTDNWGKRGFNATATIQYLRDYGTHVLGTLIRVLGLAVKLADSLEEGQLFLPAKHVSAAGWAPR